MPRHRLEITADVPLEDQEEAARLIALVKAFLGEVNPLAQPQPSVEINPVPEPEGGEGSDLTIAEKKLIIPGQNGQPK